MTLSKIPGKRPLFTKMMQDIKRGIYDGIVAWNPDRLARNMREAGDIIDLIDTNVIKDLKFVTHPFSNSANGKMLLGMAFVLSKQYSDDLSQKVKWGNSHKFLEGKSHIPKHGYKINDDGYYDPAGNNYHLMCDAWQMRLKGTPLEEISDYMNKNGYGRIIFKKKRADRIVKMDKRTLSEIFRDPFYYGVLVVKGESIDLRQFYKFKPVVTEQEWNEVQQLSYKRIRPLTLHKRLTLYPLRGMVFCTFCGESMVVGPSKGGSGKVYINYRCDNKNCSRKKKSIRAYIIFDFIFDFVAKGLNLTEADYRRYYDSLSKLTMESRNRLLTDRHSKEGQIKYIERQVKDISLGLAKVGLMDSVIKTNQEKITELETEKATLKLQIDDINSKLTDPEKDKLTLEQFLNLSRNAGKLLRSANVGLQDAIVRQIFLNLTVDESKVTSHQLKEPFATLLKTRQQHSGRGDST